MRLDRLDCSGIHVSKEALRFPRFRIWQIHFACTLLSLHPVVPLTEHNVVSMASVPRHAASAGSLQQSNVHTPTVE